MKNSKIIIGAGALLVGVCAAVVLTPALKTKPAASVQPVSSTAGDKAQPVASVGSDTVSTPSTQPAEDAAVASQKDIPLPEPGPQLAEVDPNEVINMWKVDDGNPTSEDGGVTAYNVQVDPTIVSSLQMGQTLEFEIPHLNQSYKAQLTSTHNQLDDVHVFKGKIENGSNVENVIVTRGEIETYVTVSTEQGVYTTRIDNKTGRSTVVSETDRLRTITNFNDALPAPEVPITPPQKDNG
ncbi:hypothetical protein KCM76_09700 [Zooshikella marina]|uniref:hypothetical protein n=1 Tax=Zooshikella ganghwensis TaxID=202772 RepID=UPI0003F76B99|nr:hypothetical protein [Zooshikella ganghwensis]MBU2706261.1 hypothetical protein [Zooshikella ganghwensis]